MAEDRVRIEVADHVAVVTLSRPDKHNALDRAMFEGIAAAAEEGGRTPGVRAALPRGAGGGGAPPGGRAVVLRGAGPSFCSGLDIASILADGPSGFSFLDDRS